MTVAAGGGLWALAGVSAFILPEDVSWPLMAASVKIDQGCFLWGLMQSDDERRVNPIGSSAVLGGYIGSGLLELAYLGRPRVGGARLRADYKAIRTSEQRVEITRERLAQIERDVDASEAPFHPLIMGMPLAVGGAVAIAAGFDQSYGSRTTLFLVGTLMELGAVSDVIRAYETPGRAYRNVFPSTRINVGMTPRGTPLLSLSGRF